MLDNRFVKH